MAIFFFNTLTICLHTESMNLKKMLHVLMAIADTSGQLLRAASVY